MACCAKVVGALLGAVPRGYSLHFWSDGHYSFEDRFDAARAVCVGASGESVVAPGVCRCGDGGEHVGEGVPGCDGLACEVGGRRCSFVGCVKCNAGGRRSTGFACGSCARVDGRTAEFVCGDKATSVEAECGSGVSAGEAAASGSERGFDAADMGSAEGVEVSPRTLANREKRHARAERKRVRKARQAEEDSVPEWRRKNVRANFHKGKFADCSEDTRKELLETQAKMLVEQNKTAIVKAEHERRRTEARMKSRLVEEEVETARLRMAAEYEKLAAASIAKRPSGFAETIVSVGGSATSVNEVVSPVSQSVSPDSSISVAELRAKNEMLDKLAEKVSQLELDLKKKDDEVKKKDDEVKRLRVVNKSPVRKGHASDAFFEQPRNGGYSSWDL